MRYNFEWDPGKARENLRKHGIAFDRAGEIIVDPLAVTVRDDEHSEDEERWVTIGKDRHGSILLLIHTFSEITAEECRIRIISARKANKRETRQYKETQP